MTRSPLNLTTNPNDNPNAFGPNLPTTLSVKSLPVKVLDFNPAAITTKISSGLNALGFPTSKESKPLTINESPIKPTFANILEAPAYVASKFYIEPAFNFLSSAVTLATGKELPKLSIPSLTAGNLIDGSSYQQKYVSAIENGADPKDAYKNVLIGGLNDALILAPEIKGVAKASILKVKPSALIKPSIETVSKETMFDLFSGRKTAEQLGLKPEVRNLITDKMKAMSTQEKVQFLQGFDLLNAKPSTLGKLFGVSDKEAQSILDNAYGGPVRETAAGALPGYQEFQPNPQAGSADLGFGGPKRGKAVGFGQYNDLGFPTKPADFAIDKNNIPITTPFGEKLPLNVDGTITVYHRTTPEIAQKIKQNGLLGSTVQGEEGKVYVSTNKEGGRNIGKDKTEVLQFNVDPKKFNIDEAFRDGTIDLVANAKDLTGVKPNEIKNTAEAVNNAAERAIAGEDFGPRENKPAKLKEKNPVFETGDTLKDLKMSLDYAERRLGIQKKLSEAEIAAKKTPENIQKEKKERGINVKKLELPTNLKTKQDQISGLSEVINGLKSVLDEHPGKKLQFSSKNSENLLAGTSFSSDFDNPDKIREVVDEYKNLQERVKVLEKQRLDTKKSFYNERKDFFTTERDRLAVNGILEREYRLKAMREVEKILRKEGRDRKEKVSAIQDFFSLTDKEMAKIKGNPDFRLLTDKEFENYLKGIEGKAYTTSIHRDAILQIETTIQEMELKKVDNLREALKLKKLENMSLNELYAFNDLMETFKKGDEFLGKRQLETIELTDMAGIKTKREALDFLAREAGVPIETLKDIRVSEFDKFLYDTPLARKNPLYRVMVDNVNMAEVQAGLRYQETKTDVEKLIREARASRKKTILEKAIPTDHMIFDYLESPAETKIEIAKRMTPAEYKAATFIKDKYEDVRDYLIDQNTLTKFRTNYITHVRRSFLEAWKESSKDISLTKGVAKGFVQAMKELFEVYDQEKAIFNILDQKTGEVLPLEKFFKFSVARKGGLVPSRNVAKAFLEYMRTFEKKVQFDSFIPKLDIFAHVLSPTMMTPRGLDFDDSLKRFVKQWLNNKKGRVMDTGITPGGKLDWAIRSGVTLTRILDLGLNIPVGLASNVGEQVFTFSQLGPKKYSLGVARFTTKQGRIIARKYESLVGEKFFDKMRDTTKSLGEKFSEGIFGLFSSANRRASSIELLAEMTPEEFKAGELSDEKLAEIRKQISRYHVVSGTESLYGKTPLGLVGKQYKTWAIPAFHTTLDNLGKISKKLRAGEFKETFKSQEGKELMRMAIIVSSLLLTSYGTYDHLKNKKGRSFLENLAYKSMNDALSILSAMNPALFFSEPRLVSFFADLTSSISNVVVSLTTDSRTAEGDVEGLSKLKSTITPALVRQAQGSKKTDKEKKQEPIREIYNQAAKLVKEGKQDDAQALIDGLSDNDFEIYKDILSSEKSKATQQGKKDILPIYEQIVKLVKEGKPDDAQNILNGLTDKEYHYYELILNQKKEEKKYSLD